MTTLKEGTLHCAVEIKEIWWGEGCRPATLCGAIAERYIDHHGTDWLLCATPALFMADISVCANEEWAKVSGIEIQVTKCPDCLAHPDMPLFILGDQ